VTAPAYLANDAAVDEQTFYRIACDPARSVVVEACAGAGKTWMLVSRILRALLDGVPPQQILAITFTRKAAGEMRQRLENWLFDFSAERSSEEERIEALRRRGLNHADAQRLAPALGSLHAQLLASGRGVGIATFHGWFSQLLRAAPLGVLDALGLAPDHDLIEGVDDLWPDLIRRFNARVADDDALRADHAFVIHRRGRLVTAQWLRNTWARRVEFVLADAAGVVDRSMPAMDEAYPAFAGMADPAQRLLAHGPAAQLSALVRRMNAHAGQPRKRADLLEDAIDEPDAARQLAAVREALLTKKGTLRVVLQIDVLKEALQPVLDLLDEIERAQQQHEAHALHGCMTRLSRVLLDEYAVLERERGLVDMADLERSALALLGDPATSGRLQERLDARIAHLLVDEFQDTNPIQWHALYAWLSGYAGAGAGRVPSVFIVGDPKQSIYRFRGAEPQVFEQAKQFIARGLGGTVLACDHSRRLEPGVRDVVNRVFGAAADAGEFSGFRPHTTDCSGDEGPALLALPAVARPLRKNAAAAAVSDDADADGEDEDPDAIFESGWRDSLTVPKLVPQERLRRHEARTVAAAIRATIAMGTPPADIMVLSRKRDPLRLLAEELRMHGVPFAAPEARNLATEPEVSDILALLSFLVMPADSLSLAQALKSPIFGAADSDLVTLAAAVRREGGNWWAALRRGHGESAAIVRARALLPPWIAAARQLPPHDLLDRIVAQGDLQARYAAAVPPSQRAAALSAIDDLLAMALSLDAGRYASPLRFVHELRRRDLRVAAAPAAGTVALLTIHGAKGLEAPVVFVMDTEPERQADARATVLVDWKAADRHPRCFAFVASEARFPPALDALVQQEQALREREEMNSLYVALTRARRQVVASRTPPLQPGLLPSWWSRLEGSSQAWAPNADPAGTLNLETIVLRRLPRWTGSAPVAEARDGGIGDGNSRSDSPIAALGQAVHRLLQWAAPSAPAVSAPVVVATAAAAACAEFGVPSAQADEVAAIAQRILSGSATRRFFDSAELVWAGNEVPIVLDDGRDARIDRLVAIAGEAGSRCWWVLDYKLAHAANAAQRHRPQLEAYARAVALRQPGEPVRMAVIGGDGECVELVAAAHQPRN
jgi:ATP-dependent helicase/nuclease subunit A